MKPSILIASTGADAPTYNAVADALIAADASVLVIEVDKIASGEHRFDVLIRSAGSVRIRYRDRTFDCTEFHAAWLRHPDIFGYDLSDRAKQMCLALEAGYLLDALWGAIPDDVWLNSPRYLEHARIKLLQLMTAATLGFNIPTTLVANKWSVVKEQFGRDTFIAKMTNGLIYDKGDAKTVYTTCLNANDLGALANSNPFPAIFQSYVPKRREWRVTIVGDDVFPVAIHTSASAKDDWRLHQLGEDVSFSAMTLPEEMTILCFTYLKHYGLRYGAFDFVEDEDGRFIFLELNANGQYLWLEKRLGMNVSTAIASELLRIARLRRTRTC